HRVDCELGDKRPDHPVHKLFVSQYSMPLPKRCPKRRIPVAKATVTYEYRFDLDHKDSQAAHVASVRKLALKRQIGWLTDADGKRPPTRYVREFKQHPAATAYILSDNRQTICDRGYTLSIRKLMLAVRIASRSTTKLLPWFRQKHRNTSLCTALCMHDPAGF